MVRWRFIGLVLLIAALPSWALADPIRIDGLGKAPKDRIAIFIARGDGVSTPLVAFQERARRLIEAHMYAEIVSMRETLSRGGSVFNAKLTACQADARCYADLIGRTVDARFLLVLTAARLDDLRLAGARLLDLEKQTVLGESIEEVQLEQTFLDALAARIRACIPQSRWDPFGRIKVTSEAGAQVLVEGRVIGLTPIPEIGYLVPGKYAVAVRKAGFLPASKDVEVEQGLVRSVEIPLVLAEQASETNWWLWAGIGAGAGVAAAVITAVVLTSGGGDGASFCTAPDPTSCR